MQIRSARAFFIIVIAAVTIGLISPTVHADSKRLNISAAKAPVAPDGTTAGAVTDFVITFRDIDPDVKGINLHEGATIEVVLSDAFTNTGAGGNITVLLQGWPQSPPAPPPLFPWTVDYNGNTITLTLTDKFKRGAIGPGAKQVHLILLGYTNPTLPGVYPFELTIRPKPGKGKKLKGSGAVRIIPDARPSVNPISLFSGVPGTPPPLVNPIYQDLELGEVGLPVGLYLWDANSVPSMGTDLAATASPTYYQLTQGAVVIGEVFISAPDGAEDFSLSSVALPPGGPPSVSVSAFVTAVPVGLLGVQFTPDPEVAGDYEIAIAMRGGNESTLFVTVGDDDDDDDDDGDDDD